MCPDNYANYDFLFLICCISNFKLSDSVRLEQKQLAAGENREELNSSQPMSLTPARPPAPRSE